MCKLHMDCEGRHFEIEAALVKWAIAGEGRTAEAHAEVGKQILAQYRLKPKP